jgi:hypothetical protein
MSKQKHGRLGITAMFRIDESMKTVFAMMLGAITSVGTFFSGAINKFSINMASVPVLSMEYLYLVFTAFVMGMAGAFGGLVIREAYKAIVKIIFPHKSKNTQSNSKDDDE